MGDTLITKSRDETKGKTEAELIEVQAKNESSIKIAKKMLEIAQTKAETIEMQANGEAQISKVMQARRKYEHLGKKLEVIEGFRSNPNLKVFGDNKDDVMSQLSAYNMNALKQ